MHIKLETIRLQKIINIAMMVKSSPILKEVNAKFTSKGLAITDISVPGVAVIAVFNKDYFIDYEVPEDETIVLNEALFNILKNSFRAEHITLETDKENLILRTDKETWENPLQAVTETEEYSANSTKYGLLPKKLPLEALVVKGSLAIEELQNLPDTSDYIFETKDKALKVLAENIGKYKKNLKYDGEVGDVTAKVDADYLKASLNNFVGTVNLLIQKNESGESDVVLVTYADKSMMVTYVLSTKD